MRPLNFVYSIFCSNLEEEGGVDRIVFGEICQTFYYRLLQFAFFKLNKNSVFGNKWPQNGIDFGPPNHSLALLYGVRGIYGPIQQYKDISIFAVWPQYSHHIFAISQSIDSFI
jgi:hypothetical protein